MSAATLNAFPPLHQLTFRHWTLLIIVALHAAFFWMLNSEFSRGFVVELIRPSILLPPKPPDDTPKANPDPIIERIELPLRPLILPKPVAPHIEIEIAEGAIAVPDTTATDFAPVPRHVPREPAITAPETDPRVGLSEPTYPASEIRAGHEGTVLLSVLVLENGRVGEVRIDRSSGYPKLDQSAVREARRWRFKPGLRDGAPVTMWKQVPITFQIRDAERSPILRY